MTAGTDLRGRCAIVTGAGKGLGRAYALHLAACGARVLVNNRRHPGEADADTSAAQTVAAIRAAGGTAEANWSDVTDPDSGQAMVRQAIEQLGGLHIVVANAGVDTPTAFHKQSMADFRAIFDTSFFGNLHLAHAAWPHLMQQRQGRMVLTASSAGLHANHGQSAYSAAKAAVIGLMRALAIEGRKHGVRVNVIAPYGYSQMTAPYMPPDMARSFDPALVAPLVGWLCSDACDVSAARCWSAAPAWCAGPRSAKATRWRCHGRAVGDVVHGLQGSALQHYGSANDSFARFLQELAHSNPPLSQE
jgi:NAD(P)-dependent dehydrogenase (short-subunit alcohol dehydrogenase family)